jgi:hypothetical protein
MFGEPVRGVEGIQMEEAKEAATDEDGEKEGKEEDLSEDGECV